MSFKRPFSVLVAIWTQDGETLLLHRQAPARFWQSITGSLEVNETPQAAAVREIREETGLVVTEHDLRNLHMTNRYPIPEKWASRYAPGQRHNTEHVFTLCLPQQTRITIDPTEHSDARWCPIPEAIALVWSWTNKDLLTLIQTELGA